MLAREPRARATIEPARGLRPARPSRTASTAGASPTARAARAAAIAAALAALVAILAGGGARAQDTGFPVRVPLDPFHRFFLFGDEIRGELVFTHVDSALYVNGRKILPIAPGQPRLPAGSRLLELYGGVPEVEDCVARGGTAAACVAAFMARQDSMILHVADRWRSLRRMCNAEPDAETAARIADSALVLLDPRIVGDLSSARAAAHITADGTFSYPVPGALTSLVVVSIPADDARIPIASAPISQEAALEKARAWASLLETPRSAVVVISRSGETVVVGSPARHLIAEIESIISDPAYQPVRLSPGQAREFRAQGLRRKGG